MRSDLNATGAISSGAISVPDTSFVQNSFSELSDDLVNTEQFVASSCIARNDTSGTFIISSTGTLPETPESRSSTYPTGIVRSGTGAIVLEEESFQKREAGS